MRMDLFLWCIDRLGLRATDVWCTREEAPKTALLWTPKSVTFGVQYMLRAGDIDQSTLMKIAVASMCRNTKEPLLTLVRESWWPRIMRKYKVNMTNLYSKGRANSYRWFQSDKQLAVLRRAAETDIEGLRRIAFMIYNEEYKLEAKKHKIGRYLDEQFSPEGYAYAQRPVRAGEAEGDDQRT